MKKRTMKRATDRPVTKSELARELGCGSGTLSRIQGLPVRSDGRLNRIQALKWLVRCKSGHGGGWTGGARPAGLGQRAAAILRGGQAEEREAPAIDPREQAAIRFGGLFVMNALRRPVNLLTIAKTALALGCTFKQAVSLARWYAVLLALWVAEDDEKVEDHPEPDWGELATRIGELVTPAELAAWREEAGAMVEDWRRRYAAPERATC